MKITYNKNPLYTIIELDEFEKKELWYKIKLEAMEDRLYDAHFHLEEGKYYDLKRARQAVDPDYYLAEDDDQKSKLDEYCDQMLQHYIDELQSYHVGDCTCVACSCSKCHAESLIGINTMKGLGKHSAIKIDGAFGKNNERTIEEAIEYLKNYDPKPTNPKDWEKLGGYEQYVPRWKAEAKLVLDWLVNYRNQHFNEGQSNENK